eukprot:16243988-Heterocapsa_arctica.AAC.1
MVWALATRQETLSLKEAHSRLQRQRRQREEGDLVTHTVLCKRKLKMMVEDRIKANISQGLPDVFGRW